MEDQGVLVQINVIVDETEHWAYLAVPMTRYDAFIEDQAKEGFNIEDYGEIVEWGEGENPPEEVLKKIEAEYGLEPNSELKDMIENLERRRKNT